MVAINWGSTNFRAYRINDQGVIPEKITSPMGVLKIPSGQFYSVLVQEIGHWIGQGERRLLMCGMVGSRNGWSEVPHVPAPFHFTRMVTACQRLEVPNLDVWIAPGVVALDRDGIPELMRGEETEILGMEDHPTEVDQVCLPGTHSKWVTMDDGQISTFSTYMTGDLFHAICKETILNNLLDGVTPTAPEFMLGVERGLQDGALTHHLFGVRTLSLSGRLSPQGARTYLSGLLIGHEIKDATPVKQHVHLIGSTPLCSLYALALEKHGCMVSVEKPDSAARGLIRIGRELPWR